MTDLLEELNQFIWEKLIQPPDTAFADSPAPAQGYACAAAAPTV